MERHFDSFLNGKVSRIFFSWPAGRPHKTPFLRFTLNLSQKPTKGLDFMGNKTREMLHHSKKVLDHFIKSRNFIEAQKFHGKKGKTNLCFLERSFCDGIFTTPAALCSMKAISHDITSNLIHEKVQNQSCPFPPYLLENLLAEII